MAGNAPGLQIWGVATPSRSASAPIAPEGNNRTAITHLVRVFQTASCKEIKAQIESRWLY